MLGRSQQLVPATLLEGYKDEDASPELLEKFNSELIVAYEEALECGVAPVAALAAMLDFASIELERTRIDCR